MIISGGFDIVSIAMVGNSSFESFQTIIIISSVTFFVGFLLTIFGRSTPKNISPYTVNQANNANTAWTCTKCGSYNLPQTEVCACGQTRQANNPAAYNPTAYGAPVNNQTAYGAPANNPAAYNPTAYNAPANGQAPYGAPAGDPAAYAAPAYTAPAGAEPVTGAPAAPAAPAAAAPVDAANSAEEIKKYKELLDMGAITQEDFDKKKQELLGL